MIACCLTAHLRAQRLATPSLRDRPRADSFSCHPKRDPLPSLVLFWLTLVVAVSGVVVYKHTGPGVTTVTAALDRITIAHPLTEICDLEYSGQVTYASGRSSVEITCRVARARPEGEPTEPEDELLTCTFTMVALDPETKKPANIPALVCETPEEEAIFKAGEAKSLAKRKMSKTSLLATEPNDPESALIHSIWLRQLRYHDPNDPLRQPANVVPMSTTQLSTAAIMQPQYRNRHQTMIFGGFHLKQTFELAFCCAASFAHARPVSPRLGSTRLSVPGPHSPILEGGGGDGAQILLKPPPWGPVLGC